MKDSTIVIVGGTSGIGHAVGTGVIERGGRVIAMSRSAREDTVPAGAVPVAWDAAEAAFPVDAVPESVQGLVYCPGTIRLRPVGRLTEDDFREDFEINLLGAVRAIQGLLPRLKKSAAGGSIVLFSTVAVQTGMPFHASVASAKGAVEGLTRSLAAELAPRVRVNAVAPSLTDTPMASQLLATDDKRKAAAERHPLRQIGTPERIADAVLYLLSAAAWTTGEILHVDGGMSSVRLFR